MKTFIIPIILLVVMSLVLGEFTITFRPEFSVSLPKWKTALAVLLLIAGYVLVYAEGYIEGRKQGSDAVFELLDQKIKERDGELNH